jgi:hypothetical protein
MGQKSAKPVAESARSVLSKRNELLAKATVEMKSNGPLQQNIPGLPGSYQTTPDFLMKADKPEIPKLHPGTGDVNPDVISGLNKLDFVRVKNDTATYQRHKQQMIAEPQAAVVRERERKELLMEQRRQGNFSDVLIKAPGKLMESEMISLLQQLQQK